jgi:HPt (histidine-containing phosphotransfer) domain-containing protein
MTNYTYVSWDLINEVSDGNQELIIDLVNMFYQQVPVYSEQLNHLNATKDYIALGKLAHKIKGSVSLLGITDLVKGMKELESLASEGREPQRYCEYIDLFNTTCAKATIELNDILNRIKIHSHDKH